MVQGWLEKLCGELSISPAPKLNVNNLFLLRFAPEVEISISDLNPGVGFQANLYASPKARKEECFTYVMRANLLGQGTGNSRIGLSDDEKNLTLSLGLPYELDYPVFKETLEDFVNHLVYWRGVLADLENEKRMY